MSHARETLVGALATLAAGRVVEVGVGTRPEVAAALAQRGHEVVATDVVPRAVPDAVRFVRDDIVNPDPAVYEDATLVYALNCPPELQRPLVDAATHAGAAWAFTTLGGDPAVVDANPQTLSKGTLFTAPGRNTG